MTMDIQETVRRMRDELAPVLDEYSLELLDIEIEEGEWEVARSMALSAARVDGVTFSPEWLS